MLIIGTFGFYFCTCCMFVVMVRCLSMFACGVESKCVIELSFTRTLILISAEIVNGIRQ